MAQEPRTDKRVNRTSSEEQIGRQDAFDEAAKGTPEGRDRPQYTRRQSRTTKSRPNHIISPFNNVEAEGKVFINEEYEGLRISENGTAYFNFTLAVYEGKDRDGNYRESVWIKCVMFKEVAEEAEKEISEGSWVRVYGKLAGGNKASNYKVKLIVDSYEDKSQGV